jgi:hypothetical protein
MKNVLSIVVLLISLVLAPNVFSGDKIWNIFSRDKDLMVIETPFTVNIDTVKDIRLIKIVGTFKATKSKCSFQDSFASWIKTPFEKNIELIVSPVDEDTVTFTLPVIENNECKYKLDSFVLVLKDERLDTEVEIGSISNRTTSYSFLKDNKSGGAYQTEFNATCENKFVPSVAGNGAILDTLSPEHCTYRNGDFYVLENVYSFSCGLAPFDYLKKGQSELTLKIQ